MLRRCASRLSAPTRVPIARLSNYANAARRVEPLRVPTMAIRNVAAPRSAPQVPLARAGLLCAARIISAPTINRPNLVPPAKLPRSAYATMTMPDPSRYRNFAIIAHVDHGKTSLVDKLLHLGAELNESSGERVMDSNDLERERGITILAKTTSITWNGYHFNIVDTPGHGDFGGEVERVLNMVDGVILLVDASEGPMPQTKFVLTKALRQGLRPIVVLNKMDRDTQRATEVEGEIFDLFAALDATNEQLNYPTLYASARQGWAVKNMGDERKDMTPLFETVLSYVPPPKVNVQEPAFKMLVTMLEADDFLGKIVIGKVSSGAIRVGQPIKVLNNRGEKIDEGSVIKILAKRGLQRLLRDNAVGGDIVGLAGVSKATVSDTICEPSVIDAIPAPPIEPPVISMAFGVNDSPLAGKEGTKLTSNFIRDRLMKEIDHNPAVKFVPTGSDSFEVSGRGELQMSVLIENMRREGFELVVGTPNVIFKQEGKEKLEPIEEVTADVDADQIGLVIERLTARKGELKEMKQFATRARLTFLVPVRGLLGFRSEFTTETRGTGVLNSSFHSYAPYKGGVTTARKGALISQTEGVATTYALESLADRGTLFIGAQTPVYSGMIIGESAKPGDIEANPCKAKHLTNMRAVGKEEVVRIPPPKLMTLEEAIAYVGPDELIEVTPKSIRLRKKELDENKRRRNSKASVQAKKH